MIFSRRECCHPHSGKSEVQCQLGHWYNPTALIFHGHTDGSAGVVPSVTKTRQVWQFYWLLTVLKILQIATTANHQSNENLTAVSILGANQETNSLHWMHGPTGAQEQTDEAK